jgi:hypothetical protein
MINIGYGCNMKIYEDNTIPKVIIMDKEVKERRRISQTGLIDAAMRSANQLFSSKDSMARTAASRVLGDLQKLRAEMHRRRQDDDKSSGHH